MFGRFFGCWVQLSLAAFFRWVPLRREIFSARFASEPSLCALFSFLGDGGGCYGRSVVAEMLWNRVWGFRLATPSMEYAQYFALYKWVDAVVIHHSIRVRYMYIGRCSRYNWLYKRSFEYDLSIPYMSDSSKWAEDSRSRLKDQIVDKSHRNLSIT